MGLVFGGRGVVEPAELVEEPSRERLERAADAMLTGESQREPGGQERGEEGRVHGGGLV